MRNDHLFQFSASRIARAAADEAKYHTDREAYWKVEYETSVKQVEKTISAKLQRQPVTGGFRIDVVVDYGDRVAYNRMQEAFDKIDKHRKAADRFKSEQRIYASQPDEKVYELDASDVHYFRLGGQEREE